MAWCRRIQIRLVIIPIFGISMTSAEAAPFTQATGAVSLSGISCAQPNSSSSGASSADALAYCIGFGG